MAVYTLEQRWEVGLAIDLQKIPILEKNIIFSDETHLDLGGYLNKQNCCIWGTENPYADIEKPTHPKRVTVWCGFFQRHNWANFIREWSRRGRNSQCQSLRHYFENHCNAAECVLKLRTDFGRSEAPSMCSVCLLSCEKSERNWHPHR